MVDFVSGTKTFFKQTSAPTGWTKDTSNNDKSLRVVSGSIGSGGSVAFSSVFGASSWPGTFTPNPGGASGSFTLTNNEIPAHRHTYYVTARSPDANGLTAPTTGRVPGAQSRYYQSPLTLFTTTTDTGGGQSHNHTLDAGFTFTGSSTNMNIKYVDVIMAIKN